MTSDKVQLKSVSVSIQKTDFKIFHQDFLWLRAFPANNVCEFAGKMTACLWYKNPCSYYKLTSTSSPKI